MIFGGEQTRAFCFVDDAIRATQLIMEKEDTNGKIVHIGNSDEEIKIMDLARMLIELSGFNISLIKRDPPEGSINRRCPDISLLKSFGFYDFSGNRIKYKGLNIYQDILVKDGTRSTTETLNSLRIIYYFR